MGRTTSESNREKKQKNKQKIIVVIPAFNEEIYIGRVIEKIPELVETIIVIDDGSSDQTGEIAKKTDNERVIVIRHEQNSGVGAAMITGYQRALQLGADIVVKIDGDGQMDPKQVPRLISPIVAGLADYTKGFRFHDPENIKQMPRVRLFGNIALSFLTKIVSGYWNVFDPTSGFTAIHRIALSRIVTQHLNKGYFFETDMLIHLYPLRAVVHDVHISTSYGEEVSQLKPSDILKTFPHLFIKAFFSRIMTRYFLTDFTAVSLFIILGLPLFFFGFFFGLYHWLANLMIHAATPTGTIMISVVSLLFGFQLLLQALVLDVNNFPKTPIQRLDVEELS